MARCRDYTLLALGARYAATTTGDAVDIGASQDLLIALTVSTITGSPTSLDVKLQGSCDGTNFGDFSTAVAFTQVTSATGTECIRLSGLGAQWVRAVATIVGGVVTTATYTFKVLVTGKTA